MTEEQMKLAVKLADEEGIHGVEEYGEYSGRGMYGETTHAITLDDSDDIGAIKLLLKKAGHRVNLRSDNLGRGFIAY